jgi:iron-sulfur cluster assembly accessory protein
MLEELDIQTITVSPAASHAISNIIREKKLEGYALRVFVSSSGCGCGGVNFGMALENNIRNEDMTFDANGVKVVVDEVSIDYLRGAHIDFVNDPDRGAGFIVDSPNAQPHEHSEGECACGGSCSCNN